MSCMWTARGRHMSGMRLETILKERNDYEAMCRTRRSFASVCGAYPEICSHLLSEVGGRLHARLDLRSCASARNRRRK